MIDLERIEAAAKAAHDNQEKSPECEVTMTVAEWDLYVKLTPATVLELCGELRRLRGINAGLADRVAAQAEVLGRRAERPETIDRQHEIG